MQNSRKHIFFVKYTPNIFLELLRRRTVTSLKTNGGRARCSSDQIKLCASFFSEEHENVTYLHCREYFSEATLHDVGPSL